VRRDYDDADDDGAGDDHDDAISVGHAVTVRLLMYLSSLVVMLALDMSHIKWAVSRLFDTAVRMLLRITYIFVGYDHAPKPAG
jgi:hypothetical protein